jgi:hypothetical protein
MQSSIGIAIEKPSYPSRRGGRKMCRPLEEMERVKVMGFSVLDEDFDFMAADLCSAVPEDPNKNKICESLGAVVKVVWSLWAGGHMVSEY